LLAVVLFHDRIPWDRVQWREHSFRLVRRSGSSPIISKCIELLRSFQIN
jgi:hypothetical protein